MSLISKKVLHLNILALSAVILMLACTENETANQPKNQLPALELLSPDQTGVEFRNILDDDPLTDRNVLSFPHFYNGAGVGIGDFDNDGLPDLFFAGNEVENKIYKNLGDLKFEDKSETANINENKRWASGVSIVDINNDGLLDIYVSQCGPYDEWTDKENLFYINQGDFVFKEMGKEMGLNDGNNSTQAVFLDYDKDGDLDVYVLNESKYVLILLATIREELLDKENLQRASGKLFRNEGNLTFTDVTEEAGVLAHSFGLGVLVSDFNNDNYPDIYVANDYSEPDRMYINQKDGTFKDEVKDYTNHLSFYSMGCDVADFNNDELLDIAVVDMATADHFRGKTLMASMNSEAFNYYTKTRGYQFQYMFNVFQMNNGDGTFSDIAGMTGLQKTDWSWAALLMDMNLDGYKDYFVSNGYKKYSRDNDFRINMEKIRNANGGTVPMDMRAGLYDKMPTVELKNQLFINDGQLSFTESPEDFAYPEEGTFSYGTAYGDLDNDGDLELVINNIDKPAHVIKNNTRENQAGNYLTVKLESPDQPSLVYQSKVRIEYGDESQMAEYAFVRGYQSSMDQRVFFGLGDANKVEKLSVMWPDGNIQVIQNPNINEIQTIQYKKTNESQFYKKVDQKINLTAIENKQLGLDYVHRENDFEDFAKEILLPQRQSTLGPALTVGDMNGDGLDDIFCGGALNQKASIYIQNADGTFSKQENQYLDIDVNTEDIDACFVDPNKDSKMDLLIASGGGGEMANETEVLYDRFYANVNGQYAKTANVIPNLASASYRIKSADLDGDGTEEVLICGAAKPGKYPLSETTRLYSYNGRAYVDVTAQRAPGLEELRLVRDAVFVDLNQDKILDILLVSEWGSPQVFASKADGTYENKSSDYFKKEKMGWWASITPVDVDNDGDQDFIIGNMGKNLKHKVSDEKPLYLYANDFDKNGTLDVVLAKEYKGKIVPARGRECSSQQMPFILDKFETYTSFANADINEIYGDEYIEESNKYLATTFAHYLLRNEGDHFTYEILPQLAQIAPLSAAVSYDFNDDGYQDIIIAGNYYDTEYETPRQDAGRGLVLMNNKGKDFTALTPRESGLELNGNFRKLAIAKRANDQLLIASENNGPLKVYKLGK